MMMALPTWNGEPVTEDTLASVQRESFKLLTKVMRGDIPMTCRCRSCCTWSRRAVILRRWRCGPGCSFSRVPARLALPGR